MSDPTNGMITGAWGPALWHVMYCVAANYNLEPTDADRLRAARFIRSIALSLPCGKCRQNFPQNAREANLSTSTFDSRETLFVFIYNLHASVTRALGREMKFTQAEAREFIESLRARCGATGHVGCDVQEVPTVRKPRMVLRVVPSDHDAATLRVNPACVAPANSKVPLLPGKKK